MNLKTLNNASRAGIKKTIASLAVVALAGLANASVTLFPDGDFESPAGGNGAWTPVSGGGSYVYSYPSTGGNPTGYGIMDNTGGGGGFGIWVNATSLASMGLVAGQTYTFVEDMKIISGASIGGLKIDFSPSGSTGDMRPASGTGAWATYSYTVTIPAGTTGLTAVPLWGPNSSVAYDNIGVSIPVVPLSVTISSPAAGATVGTNYSINATATVSPATVTNVNFYDGATLLGNDATFPFSYAVNGAAAGAHALKAVARDSNGNSATSSVVNITVSTAVVNPYEKFNYSLGSFTTGTASTATGFTGNWTVGNGTMVAGLTYPSLPVGSNALSTTGSRDQVSLASPLSSGTKYVAFLFNQAGNNGGNLNGLFLPGSGTTSLIVGITAPFSGTVGGLGLGAVATAGAGAVGITTFSGQQVNTFTYNQTHLIVLKIDFNTSGANDTVSLWLDPAAGVAAPAGAANLVWSAYDVGTISGLGFNIQGGGNADKFDEIRIGDTYGDVVGDLATPLSVAITSPANAATVDESFSITATATVNPGTVTNVNFYDGAALLGNATSAPYTYPVSGFSAGAHALKAVAQGSNGNKATSSVVNVTVVIVPPTVISAYESFNYASLANGNASTATGFTGNWTIAGTANIIGGLTYPSLPTLNNAFQQSPAGQRDVVALGTTLVKGTVYLSFLYNQTGNNGGNVNGLYLPGTGATSLYVGLTAPWSADAGSLGLGTIATAGAGAAGLSSVLAQMPGPGQVMNYNQVNLIVVKIEFSTSGANDTVSLWLNPTAGMSAPAGNINDPSPDLVVSNYDVGNITGIGFNFQGGGAAQQYDEIRLANTFGEAVGYVVGGVNTSPTNLTSSVTGNQLTLTWPADHTGWKLQSQTNDLNTGISTTWYDVAGSAATNQMTIPIDPASPAVFYRMTYP